MQQCHHRRIVVVVENATQGNDVCAAGQRIAEHVTRADRDPVLKALVPQTLIGQCCHRRQVEEGPQAAGATP
jgi:hypothetical protein